MIRNENNLNRYLTLIREKASSKIMKDQKKSSELFQKHHKCHAEFKEGDFVVIRNVDTAIGTNKKFIEKYKGPYCIKKVLPHDRYVVTDIENCTLSQLPYEGIVEACRIRKWVDWRDKCEDNSNPK